MKYFFVVEKDSTSHVIVAENEDNAKRILSRNNIVAKDMYELTANIFKVEGFLISDAKTVVNGD